MYTIMLFSHVFVEEANIQFAEAEKADSLLKELMGGSPKVAEKNAKDSSLESASQQTDTSQSDHMANTLKSQQEKSRSNN